MYKRLATFIATLTLGLASVALFDTASASAATLTWTGGAGDHKLSTSNNWLLGQVPTSGDSIEFPGETPDSYITIDIDVSLRAVSFNASKLTLLSENGNILKTDRISVGRDTHITAEGVLIGVAEDSFYDGSEGIEIAEGSLLYINGTLTGASEKVQLSGRGGDLGAGEIQFNGYCTDKPTTNYLELRDGVKVTLKDGVSGVCLVLPHTVEVFEDSELSIEQEFTIMAVPLGSNKTIVHSGVLLFPSGLSTSRNIQLDENAKLGVNNKKVNESGLITLSGDININGNVAYYDDMYTGTNLKLTGNLSGGKLIPVAGSSGNVLVELANGKTNNSKTPNGTTKPEKKITTITNSNADALTIRKNNVVVINGKRGEVTVHSGGTLKGTGSVGVLTVLSGGHVAPGESPGCLSAGNTTFNEDSHFDVELAGTTVCSEYDQLKVTGTVNLGNVNLNVSFLNNFKPKTGDKLTILDNDGTDDITGTFKDLPEGSTFTVDGIVFKITYKGGDGNDVVLTVESVPGTPSTGMQLLTSNPLLTLALTTISAVGLVVFARKYSQFVKG